MKVVEELEKAALLLLYKLEKIFPPRNEVHDPKDLEMLDGLRLGNDNDEDEAVEDLNNLDSDDDTYRPDNPDHEEY